MVRADKAYYRTHRGDVVGGDHPDRHTLICKAGEPIDDETAREVGLIEPVGLPVEVEAPALAGRSRGASSGGDRTADDSGGQSAETS